MDTMRMMYEALEYIPTSMVYMGMDSRSEVLRLGDSLAAITDLHWGSVGRNFFFKFYRRAMMYLQSVQEGLSPVYFFRQWFLGKGDTQDAAMSAYYLHYVDFCRELLQVSGKLTLSFCLLIC